MFRSKVLSKPSIDICISAPEFQKKNPVAIKFFDRASRMEVVLWSWNRNFINVDFPDPGFPVIQYRGSPSDSQLEKLDQGIPEGLGSEYIHSKVFLYATGIRDSRYSISSNARFFKNFSQSARKRGSEMSC